MSSTTPTLHSDSRSAEPHERSRRTPATGMGVRTLLAHGIEQFPEAVRKLDPRHMWRTPVMFLVWLGSLLTTLVAIVDPSVFAASIAAWLWLTVIFGNLAEAVAEGRGKAQAASLRATRSDTMARLLDEEGNETEVPGTSSGSVTASSSRPARSSPATVTSSRASPRSTSQPSPASPLR